MTDPLIPQPGSILTSFRAMFNIVLVSEGFTASELGAFRVACSSFDLTIRRTRPFDTYAMIINVMRLEAVSAVSATNLKVECGPGQGPINTRFKVHFCANKDAAGNGLPRGVDGDTAGVVAAIEATGLLSGMPYHPLVLVNNIGHAGTASPPVAVAGAPSRSVAWFTIEPGWERTAVHELGHSAFDLGDEYEGDGTPTAPAGVTVTTPNITTAASRAALAVESVTEHQVWASFIKSITPSPATAPKIAQSPAPDDLSTEPLASGVTAKDVGLFEGASHHQLGIFRPFADCRMRHSQASFCPVCEHTIRARLGAWELPSEKPITSFAAGQVTHVFTVPLLALAFGTYDITSGAVHLFEGFSTTFGVAQKDLIAPGAALPTGCTSVVSFDGPGGPFVYTHSFPTGARQVHRFVPTAAGIDIQLVFDTGPAFDAPWTSVSLPFVAGQFHVLGYNRFTGEAALTPLDLVNPAPPDLVSWRDPSRVWQAGWPHVEAFNLREKLLLLRASTFGPRDIQSLLPIGPRPRDWLLGDTTEPDGSTHHLLYQTAGSLRLIRYSAISGRLALDALRPDGSDVDFVGARRFAPGGLSLLGQEAPVFAVGLVIQQSPLTLMHVLAWHHAPTQTLRLHVMSAVSS